MVASRKCFVSRIALPTALELLAKETSKLQAEIEGFENFLERLNEISPQPHRTDSGTLSSTLPLQASSVHSPQDDVQTAYRETVLSVDHWKDAYGKETALDSIAEEFGTDIAACLTASSQTWSPLFWNRLRSASIEAIEPRQQTLQVLTEEASQLKDLHRSLTEISNELVAIERGQFPFPDRIDRLNTKQRQLEELADEQQAYLHQRKTPDEILFSSFAYADLDTDYPGIAALVTIREELDRIEFHHWAGMI